MSERVRKLAVVGLMVISLTMAVGCSSGGGTTQGATDGQGAVTGSAN